MKRTGSLSSSTTTLLFTAFILTMFTTATKRSVAAFVSRLQPQHQFRAIGSSALRYAESGQAEVILVGCGAPNRGMGWYVVQTIFKRVKMRKTDCSLCFYGNILRRRIFFRRVLVGLPLRITLSHPESSLLGSLGTMLSRCWKRSKFYKHMSY